MICIKLKKINVKYYLGKVKVEKKYYILHNWMKFAIAMPE
jgi:hypothetical protein